MLTPPEVHARISSIVAPVVVGCVYYIERQFVTAKSHVGRRVVRDGAHGNSLAAGGAVFDSRDNTILCADRVRRPRGARLHLLWEMVATLQNHRVRLSWNDALSFSCHLITPNLHLQIF